MLETPILFLIYNRPDLTRRVFEQIRRVRPRRLFVVADGPRGDRPEDRERCSAARAVVEEVDWDCDLRREYAERNLGCRLRVSSGVSWFFGQVERGIVLEDDCLPHPSFFGFCEESLERFASDSRIMHVAGANFQEGRRWGDGSYYVSNYPTIWGWASWQRAWRHYDLAMSDYPRFLREGRLRSRIARAWERAYWAGSFQMMYEGRVDTWDHAWTFALWSHEGVAVVPNVNLVSNVGGGAEATHTRRANPGCFHLPLGEIGVIVHPSELAVRAAADTETLRRFLRCYDWRARMRLWRAFGRARLGAACLRRAHA